MLINVISVIIGLLGTIALSGTMSFKEESVAYTNSTTAFLFLVFAVLILRYVYARIKRNDRRGLVCAGLYSVVLAFGLSVGKVLHTVENLSVREPGLWIQTLFLSLFFCGPVWYLLQWLKEKGMGVEEDKAEDEKTTWKHFLITWLTIFLCWLPVFLAFYPGAFVYDALAEQVQVEMRVFSTHHPLSHVLLLGGLVAIGHKFFDSYNIGIAMYTIMQMVILSGVFAYTVWYLRKHLSKKICLGITFFYGLFPVIPMYAVCSCKDTLFNAAFLLTLIQMAKLMETAFDTRAAHKNYLWKKGDVVLFVLAASAAMLLRNNGVLALGALLLILFVVALIQQKRNKFFLRLSIMLVISLLLYGGINKGLANILNADSSGKQEPLTVPIQQLARTYQYHSQVFSDDDLEVLFSYLPKEVLADYDADLSDPVKTYFNSEKYTENPSDFLGLWLRTFVKVPEIYLNAWMMTSYGYWYPDTVINVYGGQQRFTFQYTDSSYFGFETEPPGKRDSKFPWLEEQYRRLSLELYQQNVPGISMLFSPGFLFWIFMGCFLTCFYEKRYVCLLPLTAILLLWGTVILGPTFLIRYVLILWFALPLILAMGLGECKTKEGRL